MGQNGTIPVQAHQISVRTKLRHVLNWCVARHSYLMGCQDARRCRGLAWKLQTLVHRFPVSPSFL